MFEYDPNKSQGNKLKHGVDFAEAQALWEDRDAIVVSTSHTSEPRKALIARLKGKVWIAIFTMRGRKIRIISVRRARTNEERHYHESQENLS
ncbi:BrnT family toxin [Ruficoccus amylovorans]|uniref:BrnT family toxin n=1 Tax=Ruficoccus amylovorans TaxID=1804625 RepID=A0A842HHU8_9BACT|nr:BrnT family toxin [Ruficoccus amylovorans]MBC2595982.1 BrnT family toxin [Ruficoccus amylovorans]